MAGRTELMADKALNLYRGFSASPVVATYVTLFTTNPVRDHPTLHSAVEWGPARVLVYPTGLAGAPYWSAPEDDDPEQRIRSISNVGSVLWSSITLTTSPSTIVGVGVFDALTSGNLLTWDVINPSVVVTDGESHTFGTRELKIKGD